jgi:ATP-dependent Clp protease ATP-binding subunit ClpC
MFERYTEEARRALFYARFETSQRGGTSIESEHLLVGLMRESQGPVNAILAHFQVTPVTVLQDIDARVSFKEGIPTPTSVEIPFSPEVGRALTNTEQEADRLRHLHIGPEHLFLALLGEDQSVAASVLNQQGVTQAAAREYVATLPAAAPSSGTTVSVDGRLQAIKLLVEQLSRADRGRGEAMDLVARIYQAIDALKPHLQ